jgi:DNA-binding beta-propeller fold protein YncE
MSFLTICLLFSSVIHFYSATKFGSSSLGDGQFTDPEHLAIDLDGNEYVTDRKNNNIQVFKPVN